jgi:hypothetical protein
MLARKARQLHLGVATRGKLPFRKKRKEHPTMLKPIEKPSRQTLVHHPSDLLDAFCQYDASDRSWLKFDDSLSHQLLALEFENRRYIRPPFDRRSSF